MTHSPSFSNRLLLLVALMAVISAIDFYRNRSQATKFREYGFIVLTGLLGAGVGFGNDLITSSISPDYFILGKGLEKGPDLRMEAALMGLQVGFSGGVIAGAICLFVTRRKSVQPPVDFSRLLKKLWIPVAGAILGGIMLAALCPRFDPANFAAQLDTLLNPDGINRFREVWWIHVGLYAGLVAGLAVMILQVVNRFDGLLPFFLSFWRGARSRRPGPCSRPPG